MNAIARKAYAERDRVVKAMTASGHFRLAAIRNTKTAQTAQANHNLSPLAAVLLGKSLAGASLLASFLKNEERVIVELMGGGPVAKVFAEALQVGESRGYVANPRAELDFSNPKTTITDALGAGMIRVSRVLYGNYEPVVGVVELAEGDVSTDLAYYLSQSEQIPSAIVLDVAIDDEGRIRQSGGLLVQALPGATEAGVRAVHKSLRDIGSVTDLLEAGYAPAEILAMTFAEPLEQISETPVDFFCRCSLQRFKSQLIALGLDDIAGMKEHNQRELVCHYCGARYRLSDADFEELFALLRAQKN